jgi:hypothetical protein
MPAAPIRLCDPRPVWDGHDLVVVQAGFPPCPPGAAAYDPRANRWTGLAAPPRLIGQAPVAAWGGGRLVLVSPATGVTVTWSPATGQWHQIATLPSPGAASLGWTGSTFLAITISKAVTRAFALGGGRWARLPDLPQPSKGSIAEAATAADDRAVYALAGINVPHDNPNDTYNSGSAELLRLTATAWTPVPLAPGAPRSQLALTQVDGAILAAGSACPGLGGCSLEGGTAALLQPGARDSTIPLLPKAGVPSPRDIAGGGQAIVMTYSEGLGSPLPPGTGPAPGSSAIYDIATGTWLQGPTAAGSRADLGAYWTPYGVISLGQPTRTTVDSTHIGGWLLRPA